ncbi:single-stranded DNA-binding protein [Sanguibacter suarezii]|uniref:single-stranded DNA-binding protein n=1 Tax=Sanguibacter suarezii TaxID=60921 RepID=UPI00082A1FE0|nr:single-stranded DNA-binding protein [Sanguibacter suarezii]
MSTDTKVTVTGWVGTHPKHFVSESGTDFTSFRLASTKRYYNRAEEAWVDGLTTWFTVKAWRSMAINVAESLRRSDPVVVHGTLTSETWDSPDGPRTTFVIEADAVGPDLARGQATFRHTVHTKAGEPSSAQRGADAGESATGEGAADPWAVAGTDEEPGSDSLTSDSDGNGDGASNGDSESDTDLRATSSAA